MKLLIYTEYFFPMPGGAQTVVFELANGLAQGNGNHNTKELIDVTVVTRTPGSMRDEESLPFRVVRRPAINGLIRLIREADVVHLAGPALLPMIVCFLLRKPLVIEHHGFQAACPNGLLFFEPAQAPCPGHFMARRYGQCLACNRTVVGTPKSFCWFALTPLRRWLSNRASHNIVPTNWLGSVLKLNRTTTVYHGLPQNRREEECKPCGSVFAFQGRLVTTKGVGVLLDAMRILLREHEAELKIIGDGPELSSLKSAATAANGHIKFFGHVEQPELDNVLSSAATVVMPSLGGEVFGLVAAENMMRGKTVIVSDIGALKEVVGDAGLVVPQNDAIALAASMRRLLENPGLAPTLGAAARDRAAQLFSLDSMILGHVALYKSALRHKKSAREVGRNGKA